MAPDTMNSISTSVQEPWENMEFSEEESRPLKETGKPKRQSPRQALHLTGGPLRQGPSWPVLIALSISVQESWATPNYPDGFLTPPMPDRVGKPDTASHCAFMLCSASGPQEENPNNPLWKAPAELEARAEARLSPENMLSRFSWLP